MPVSVVLAWAGAICLVSSVVSSALTSVNWEWRWPLRLAWWLIAAACVLWVAAFWVEVA